MEYVFVVLTRICERNGNGNINHTRWVPSFETLTRSKHHTKVINSVTVYKPSTSSLAKAGEKRDDKVAPSPKRTGYNLNSYVLKTLSANWEYGYVTSLFLVYSPYVARVGYVDDKVRTN